MFESRMFFVDKLISMGARIVLRRPAPGDRGRSEPAARCAGDVARYPRRHGDAARGSSCRRHIDHQQRRQIERGYERIDERLNALGAKITRVPARPSDGG